MAGGFGSDRRGRCCSGESGSQSGDGSPGCGRGAQGANAAATAGAGASVPSSAYLGAQACVSELVALFNKQVAIEDLSLGGKTYAATTEGNKAGTTKVFNTTGLSDAQLEAQAKAYVSDLTGGAPLVPVAGNPPNVWLATMPDGTTVSIRSVSSSQVGTTGRGARWTIDVNDNQTLTGVSPKLKDAEIKIKMKNPLTDARYLEIVSWSEDKELTSFWSYLEQDFPEFDDRREAFFWVLRRALREGLIALVNMRTNKPLKGTAEELLAQFGDSFPKNLVEMNQAM